MLLQGTSLILYTLAVVTAYLINSNSLLTSITVINYSPSICANDKFSLRTEFICCCCSKYLAIAPTVGNSYGSTGKNGEEYP